MIRARLESFLQQHKLLSRGATAIVGCSAGPDSMAMLHLLCSCSLDLHIIAMYVDHGLRPEETPREKKMVARMAEELRIGFETAAVDVLAHKREHGSSLEESCRLLRYAALEECRQRYGAGVIAVAHTADDQVEEIFLRLIRGTALKGLSGMKPRRDTVIRPLLWATKEELGEYLRVNTIPFCIDSSNTDTAYLRNRLRLEVLPILRNHFNPALAATLSNTADILTQDDDLLEQLARESMNRCCTFAPADNDSRGALELFLSTFFQEHLALQRRILEKILLHYSVKASFGHITRIIEFMKKAASGKQLHLPRGLRVYKAHAHLRFEQPWGPGHFRGDDATAPAAVTINACGDYEISEYGTRLQLREMDSPPGETAAGVLVVDAAKISFPLVLRPPLPGERFAPPGMDGTKKVTRYLSEKKIPRHERGYHPLVTTQNGVIAIAGLQIDRHYTVSSGTERFLLLSWQRQYR